MKLMLERIIYYIFTLFIFLVLWNVTAEIWEAFVPWNYKTDLLGLFIVLPALLVLSFIISSLCFKVIKNS
ncbi:hypothetical protein BSG1_03970 [Bacillus sp. SG-1]|nr:hypothetical protein BSG1_03970 [Bacillus sp. SG-1]